MNIPIDTTFAGIAVLVSIFSYLEGRRQVDRQNSFELRLYIITILDPVRGKIAQLIVDMNRAVNVAKHTEHLKQIMPELPVPDADPQNSLHEKFIAIDRQVSDLYGTIKHHLHLEDQREIDEQRLAFEKLMSEPFQTGIVTPKRPEELIDKASLYAKRLFRGIDCRLKDIGPGVSVFFPD